MMQLAPAVNELVHVVDGSTAYGLPVPSPEIARGTDSLFLRVTVLIALVSSTATSPKFNDVGETVVGSTPFPLSATICGLLDALSLMVSVPAGWAPNAVGVRVTPMMQLAPAANELVHVVDGSTAYGVPAIISEIAILPDSLFLRVTFLIALVSFTATSPKFNDVGETVAGGPVEELIVSVSVMFPEH